MDAATKRQLKETKFPPEYNTKVNMKNVNKDVMRSWISSRITEILENDDDVVIETCCGLLLDNEQPSIKEIHLQMIGFLGKETEPFCKELWKHCVSAQNNPKGVSQELLDDKKEELLQEDQARVRREEEKRKAKDARGQETRDRRDAYHDGGRDRFDRERGDRPPFRGRGSYQRDGRGHHGNSRDQGRNDYRRRDRSPSRSPPRGRYRPKPRSRSPSRSPPRRRRSRSPQQPPRHRRRSPSPDRRPKRRYDSLSPPRHTHSWQYYWKPKKPNNTVPNHDPVAAQEDFIPLETTTETQLPLRGSAAPASTLDVFETTHNPLSGVKLNKKPAKL